MSKSPRKQDKKEKNLFLSKLFLLESISISVHIVQLLLH